MKKKSSWKKKIRKVSKRIGKSYKIGKEIYSDIKRDVGIGELKKRRKRWATPEEFDKALLG